MGKGNRDIEAAWIAGRYSFAPVPLSEWNDVFMSNTTIKPTIIAPVIGHTVVGPAAPTPAEGKLREEFEALRADYQKLREETATSLRAAHYRIEETERFCLQCIRTTETKLHDRVKALESRWYERVVRWFREVFSCR